MTPEEAHAWGIVAVLMAAYVLPSIIALARGHHNKGAIIAVNVLPGWSVLGWIGALVWSLTAVDPALVRGRS